MTESPTPGPRLGASLASAAGWTYAGDPVETGMGAGTVTLVEGQCFCISDPNGDVAGGAQGLFHRDTRFLSSWALHVDERPLQGLAVLPNTPFSAGFLARPAPAAGAVDPHLLVRRHRYVGLGMREDLVVENLSGEAAAVNLALSVEVDFAHIFEVKEGRVGAPRPQRSSASGGALRYSLDTVGPEREVTVSGPAEAIAVPGGLVIPIVVPPRGRWTGCVQVRLGMDGQEVEPRYHCGEPVEDALPARRLASWRARTPHVRTDDPGLGLALARGEEDLGSLRIFDPAEPGRSVVAAGAPWFMTVFGRDSLIASWMALMIDPQLAISSLLTLARHQGKRIDPVSEEQPGRIAHEMRWGLALAGTQEAGVYYGSVDATPLFVMLLGELDRWGLAPEMRDRLLAHADQALTWMEEFGDADGDGFVEYRRATDKGLANQGWKDSFDGINFASGRLAQSPIALCEVQGYVYAAYQARAQLASQAGDEATAARYIERAARLKERFNAAFWMSERGYFALGLDADKAPIDSLASNMGHCLWTGIVDEDKAPAVAEALLSPEMFSGFGVRTLATSMGAYNPISYHNGSVWPHDNALVAAGLMRYGLEEGAARVIRGISDAALYFGGRLPELFCGFDRSEFPLPVRYPTACEPQAWASATPFLLLRTMLRLEPWIPRRRLAIAPSLPEGVGRVEVDNLALAGARVDIEVVGHEVRLSGLPSDIEVVHEAGGGGSGAG